MTELGETTRRGMLTVTAVGGAGLLLAACGSNSGGDGDGDADDNAGGSEGGGQPAAGTKLAALDDIPVGGTKAVDSDGKPVILTRPEQNKVVAFSAICTHKGCTVKPDGKQLACPCHGSMFETATGKVIQGPASEPLPAVTVHVAGSSIVAGKA